MTEGVRVNRSENPIQEIWKRLRYFLDLEYSSDRIRSIHGLLENQQKANVKKQAKQIGYCIRQAEDYFTASSQVGLPTKPLLLYYGAVSLSTAVVLLRQSGDYSIDVLRNKKKHNHHGLDNVIDLGGLRKPNLAIGVEHFFHSLKCNCHIEHGAPWGQFALLYKSLIPCCYIYEMEVHDAGRGTFLKLYDALQCSNMLQLDNLQKRTFDVLELVKSLPDMYYTLSDMHIRPDLCRGGIKRVVTRYYKKDEDGRQILDKTKSTYDFFFNNIDETSKGEVLSYYGRVNPDIRVIADLGQNIHLQFTVEAQVDEGKSYYLPDGVNTIDGELFYILKPETYVHEPAAHLMILFSLGMLSRYYPDLWVRIIDENVRVAEVTESLLSSIFRKFPNLILDQMTSLNHYVHI